MLKSNLAHFVRFDFGGPIYTPHLKRRCHVYIYIYICLFIRIHVDISVRPCIVTRQRLAKLGEVEDRDNKKQIDDKEQEISSLIDLRITPGQQNNADIQHALYIQGCFKGCFISMYKYIHSCLASPVSIHLYITGVPRPGALGGVRKRNPGTRGDLF